jgi:uncharacterized protein
VIVVSDASPIIGLSAVDKLDLLRQLYGKVLIPESVAREIAAGGQGRPGAAELEIADWMEVRPAGDLFLARALDREIDRGEAEAIALAVDLQADLLLADERRARRVAERLGLPVVGVLGVLIEGKQKGFISAVQPILDDLLANAGFRISPRLYSLVIRVAEEE